MPDAAESESEILTGMKAIRVGLNSLALVIADLAGIGGGNVAAYWILGAPDQIWLQLPVAVMLSIGSFLGWSVLLGRCRSGQLQVTGPNEAGVCLALSLLWAPLVFVPLHFITQGYLTGLGNLLVLALYQVPVNAISLFVPLAFRGSLGPGS